MRGLTELTGGLVGSRDPAQPLLTLRDGAARVELSGATTANWVAKTANLLRDGYGGPDRVGLVPVLHWQSVCALLGIVASGGSVLVSPDAGTLAGLDVVLAAPAQAGPLAFAGVDVLVLSTHPLGTPSAALPAGAEDFGREVLGYGDAWDGPPPSGSSRVLVDERPIVVPGDLCGPQDRVLVAVDPASPEGLPLLLGVLAAGAAAVLLPELVRADGAGPGTAAAEAAAAQATTQERATATVGLDVAGLPRLG